MCRRTRSRRFSHWKRHKTAPLELSVLGTYSTGLGEASSEIAAYDKQSRRVFVTNAVSRSVDIVDVSTPAAPTRIERIDVTALGTPNSVAIEDGLVAVAIEAPVKTDPGLVAFYTASGAPIAQVRVGSQPDMLTFTPDGKHVVVANEGEPSGYGGAADVDPEGTVSIIRVPHGEGRVEKIRRGQRAPGEFHAVQRPGSRAARAGHSHLRTRRQRGAGFRAGIHRGVGGLAHGVRDAAGEQCDRGRRHRERRGHETAAARLQGLQRASADHRHL